MTEFKFNDAALAKLKGKVAIITGGSSGIGRGTVELFASYGVKVVSVDVNESRDPLPEGATFLKCNVALWSDIVKTFREVRRVHGHIDIVCANAGISDKENLLKDDEDEPRWDVLDVNLKGVMMTVKAALYHFRRNTPVGGVVVMTGSITSYVPSHEGVYVYGACKYGVLGMLRSMWPHFPKFNSRINMVAPYLTDTGLAVAKDTAKNAYRKQQPVNQPPAIAKAIVALAADETNNGKSVICVGQKYFETEEPREKLLPQVVSSDVTENWKKVLEVNPFAHMSQGSS